MATGDQQDCLNRIKALIPRGWFPDSTPVLDALLSGPAWALALVYSLIQYAIKQTRIATATDGFLDLISYDYFGTKLPRRSGEFDAPFRARILGALLRPKATRPGMIATLVALTGRTPKIFEPWRPADTGGYGAPNCGYGGTLRWDTGHWDDGRSWDTSGGGAGGWGSLVHHAQAFIVAYRPSLAGIPYVAGYNSTPSGYSTPSRGEWTSLSQVVGFVTDQEIYDTIDSTKAAGTEMWVQIHS